MHCRSMISLLSERPYLQKRGFSYCLFFLMSLVVTLALSDIAITATASLAVHARIIFHTNVLLLSVVLFIILFWRETGGDFFSFINIILISYLIMFVIPIFSLLYFPEARTKPSYWGVASVEYSVWVVIISLYSLVFGYVLARRKRAGLTLPFSSRPSIKRMGAVFIVCIGVWLAYSLVKSSVMGINIWEFLGYHTRAGAASSKKYITGVYAIIEIFNKGAQYIFLLCLMLPRQKSVRKGMILCANLFIFFYVLNTIITGFHMTAKSTVFSAVFICFCFSHYTKKIIGFTKLALIFIFGIVTVIFLNYLRVDIEHRYIVDSSVTGIPRMYAQTFEDFETLCVVTSHIPRVRPYYYGRRLFEETAYVFVPRAFWSGKPVAYGSRAVLYDIEPWFFNVGYSIGLQSQFYADFGLPGVIAGFMVFGWLIGWVYDTFRKNAANRGLVLMYILIILNSWLYFKGGFPWLNIVIITYIPFYIVLRCIYPYPAKVKNYNERAVL